MNQASADERVPGRRPLTVVVSGYYGYDNAGDEALLEALLSEWRDVCPATRFIVLSGDPVATAARHRVQSISRTGLAGIVRALRNADAFVSGGGSLLQDATSPRTVPYYTALMGLARRLRVPVVVYSQGLGPIRRRSLRRMAGRALRRAHLLMVRDEASAREATTLGVGEQRIVVTADPVFSYSGKTRTSSERGRALLHTLPDGPILGVSLRPLQGGSRNRTDAFIDELAKRLGPLVSSFGAKVLPLPLYPAQDEYPLGRLAARLGTETVVHWPATVSPQQLTLDDWLALLQRLDLCLTMRLHGLIFAAVAETPFIALADDPKVDAHVAELGLTEGHCIIDARQVYRRADDTEPAAERDASAVGDAEAADFDALFRRAWHTREETKRALQSALPGLAKRARDGARRAVSLASRDGDVPYQSEAAPRSDRSAKGRLRPPARVSVLGTAFDAVTMDDAVATVRTWIEEPAAGEARKPFLRPAHIVTANPEIVMGARRDEGVRRMLADASLVVADGIGIVAAARLLRTPVPERVPGVELMESLLHAAADRGWRVFLLGGAPGVAEEAAANIRQTLPDIHIVGTRDGYFRPEEEPAISREVADAAPDIVFVGMGAPRQELFIAARRGSAGAEGTANSSSAEGIDGLWGTIPVAVGIGGSIDVFAGRVQRAPQRWQKLGLEWLYRLLRQPSRLRRAFVLPKFGLLVLFHAVRRNLL